MGSHLTSSLVAAMLLDDREIGRRVGATMVIGYIAYMSFSITRHRVKVKYCRIYLPFG